MSFTLRDDQKALQQGIQDFCTSRFPRDQLGAIEAWSFDRGLWSDLREMGVFALQVPEADGGLGLGMTDAALVFVEFGRALIPGPLVWTHIAAGHIEGAATGETVVGGSWNLGDAGGRGGVEGTVIRGVDAPPRVRPFAGTNGTLV